VQQTSSIVAMAVDESRIRICLYGRESNGGHRYGLGQRMRMERVNELKEGHSFGVCGRYLVTTIKLFNFTELRVSASSRAVMSNERNKRFRNSMP